MTADSAGAIGWKKVIFDVSGSIQVGSDYCTVGKGGTTSTDGVYMGTSTDVQTNTVTNALIATSSMKIYNVATNKEIEATTTDTGWYVWNYTAGGARIGFVAKDEQTIAAGETKTYELRGDISYGGKSGDSLSVKIEERSTATSTNTYETLVGNGWNYGDQFTAVTSTVPTFIWSDRSGAAATHSMGTSDWTNDYQVSGLPTNSLTLSK